MPNADTTWRGQTRSRNHRISVTSGGVGWFAVHIADYEDMGWNTDVVQTGIGRYRSSAEAAVEAREWAESEGLPCKV